MKVILTPKHWRVNTKRGLSICLTARFTPDGLYMNWVRLWPLLVRPAR